MTDWTPRFCAQCGRKTGDCVCPQMIGREVTYPVAGRMTARELWFVPKGSPVREIHIGSPHPEIPGLFLHNAQVKDCYAGQDVDMHYEACPRP